MARAKGSSYAQTLRVLRMIQAMRDGPWTVRGLAARLATTPRTVARDVAALRAAGWPLPFERVLGPRKPYEWCGRRTTLRDESAGPGCRSCRRSKAPATGLWTA